MDNSPADYSQIFNKRQSASKKIMKAPVFDYDNSVPGISKFLVERYPNKIKNFRQANAIVTIFSIVLIIISIMIVFNSVFRRPKTELPDVRAVRQFLPNGTPR